MRKESAASRKVVRRFGQSVPRTAQNHTRSAMSLGRLKKIGSSHRMADAISHVPKKAPASRPCHTKMGTDGLAALLIASDDLVAQLVPDLLVKRAKARVSSDV